MTLPIVFSWQQHNVSSDTFVRGIFMQTKSWNNAFAAVFLSVQTSVLAGHCDNFLRAENSKGEAVDNLSTIYIA